MSATRRFLLPGDYAVAWTPERLETLLGSCVSVCLFNPGRGFGAMNHFLLPATGLASRPEVGRYADTAVAAVVGALLARDADPRHYQARVFGGAAIIGAVGPLADIGARNVDAARRALAEARIAVVAEDVGGRRGRRINFNTADGSVDSRPIGAAARPAAKESHMRSLVVEDESISRRILQRVLATRGECHVAVNGTEAVQAIETALAAGEPYDLVCLDIMLPDIDGHAVLARLRALEAEHGVGLGQGARIMMTTALSTPDHVLGAFRSGCDTYVVKPLEVGKLVEALDKLSPRRAHITSVAP